MKLLEDTKTNMNRKDITDPTNAKYRADKLYTELIFNKYDPNETVQSVTNTNYKNAITYTVNSVAYPDSFDNDLNVVCTNGIHFFKSIERALLWDLLNVIYTSKYKTYYDSGQIKSKCNYIDGKKCGELIEYYKDGQIIMKCNYIDDELCDEYIRYYNDGQISMNCNYNDDKLNGACITYYNNGQIYIKCNYIDDKKCGEYNEYYENGQILIKCDYYDDELCGEYIYYYENGQIESKCNYIYGSCYNCIRYLSNGHIDLKCNYNDDQLVFYCE